MASHRTIRNIQLLSVFAVLMFFSCKKEADVLRFEGKVFDPNLNKNVEGATVKLYTQQVVSGVFNPTFKEVASVVSNGEGKFEIEVKKEKFGALKIEIGKENYFDARQEIDPEKLKYDAANTVDFNLYPVSDFILKVRNQTQLNAQDYVAYKFLNMDFECETCCNNLPRFGVGKDFYVEHECQTPGNRWVKIFWDVKLGANAYSKTDSVFCNAFETTVFEIVY